MEWFTDFFNLSWCLLRAFLNLILDVLSDVWYYTIGLALRLLPDSPFNPEPLNWGNFGNSIGYFIPVQQMAMHLTAILAAVLIYYVVRHLLRLAQMIR